MNPPLFFDPRDYGAAADGRTAARSGTTHPRVAPPVGAPTPPPPPAD